MDFLLALDVLLGLSLIYLVFALAVTSINEFIAAALSSRARWLRRGIASLLSADPRSLDTERRTRCSTRPSCRTWVRAASGRPSG